MGFSVLSIHPLNSSFFARKTPCVFPQSLILNLILPPGLQTNEYYRNQRLFCQKIYYFENLPELLVVPGDKGWGIVWFSQMERSWWILPTARLDNTMVITISGHLSLYHHHQQTKQAEEFYQVWQTDRPRPTMRRWPGIRQGPTMRRWPGLRPRPTMRRWPGLRPRPTMRRWPGLRPRPRCHNNERV